MPFALLVTLLVLGGLALLLALNTASAANELRRRDLAQQDTTIAATLEGLRNQVAASAAPGNLEKAARSLGMVPATKPAFLVVGADGRLHARGKAGAVTGPVIAAPRTKAKAKPKPTTSPTASKSASKSTAKSASKSAAKSSSKSASRSPSTARSTPKATPTPTPTPTVVLPGGAR